MTSLLCTRTPVTRSWLVTASTEQPVMQRRPDAPAASTRARTSSTLSTHEPRGMDGAERDR